MLVLVTVQKLISYKNFRQRCRFANAVVSPTLSFRLIL